MIFVGLRLISMIVGYVFGTIQTAYFYGKAHGIDIREHGSGNAGTTNTLRVMGPKAGLVVFAGDAGKCILSVLLIRFTLGEIYPDLSYLFVYNHKVRFFGKPSVKPRSVCSDDSHGTEGHAWNLISGNIN